MHRDVIEKLLEGDLTKDQIAASVKKSRQTIYNWLKDPLFSEELEERKRQRDALYKARLARNAGYALDRARKILNDSEDDRAAATVIADTLDRAGYPKLKQVDLKHEHDVKPGGMIFIPAVDEDITNGEAEKN
ncbi:MAG: hypothetical protein IJH94_02045 [Clostridia bacterium]|nr:hypothetical protein [Clostridia bacterium]